MREFPLAELIPLWRTLREHDTTVLVTPALDYVAALELGGLDIRFLGDEQVAGTGEALRSFVGGLDDGCNLLFLQRIYEGDLASIRRYEAVTKGADPAALHEYVTARVAWLREQPVRRSRLFLFLTKGGSSKTSLERGNLGMKLLFKKLSSFTQAEHDRRVKELATLRDRVASRLQQIGVSSRELTLEEVWQLHYELLNPNRAKSRPLPPNIVLLDNLWSDAFVKQEGRHLLEYTEAEQLCFEDIEDGRGYFRQGDTWRRVATLKVLPENGTDYFLTRPLQCLGARSKDGALLPFAYTLTVAINIESQPFTRWKLNTQHKLVEAMRNSVPFLQSHSIGQAVEDHARQRSIQNLFEELNERATKVTSLSVSLLLDASTPEELEARTEIARAAFAAAGNSELMVEDVAQIPAFLSVLPGSGPYQLRRKGCTSRNAADFIPIYASWRGGQTTSLMLTPTGEFFSFAPFDRTLTNASHAIVAADTGAGKSVTIGALVLDALAAGYDAILVDNGNSWRQLTELVNGVHIPVDLRTSISPFGPYEVMLDKDGQLDNEAIQQIVRFIEICVTDHSLPSFDHLQRDVVGRAVARCYRERFRFLTRPGARPLLGDFREVLQVIADDVQGQPREREIAADLHLRLRMFCDEDGTYSKLLNRPSQMRFDSRLLCFEMEKVSKDPLTKKIALAAIMEAVSTRAASRRRSTIVAVDEAHEYLGADPAAEKWLGGCYAKMRKYDVAMWTISQKFETFAASPIAPTIIGNSALKMFLWHSSGHATVGKYFALPPRAVQEFASLQRVRGRYSDVFLMYGERRGTMRVALHPLAYWILTTDPSDLRMLQRAVDKNPTLDRLTLIKQLAALYPHGADSGPIGPARVA